MIRAFLLSSTSMASACLILTACFGDSPRHGGVVGELRDEAYDLVALERVRSVDRALDCDTGYPTTVDLYLTSSTYSGTGQFSVEVESEPHPDFVACIGLQIRTEQLVDTVVVGPVLFRGTPSIRDRYFFTAIHFGDSISSFAVELPIHGR